ncbi:hypothetical protein ACFL35_11310 [Candidatus Riflebacteria bacterium]
MLQRPISIQVSKTINLLREASPAKIFFCTFIFFLFQNNAFAGKYYPNDAIPVEKKPSYHFVKSKKRLERIALPERQNFEYSPPIRQYYPEDRSDRIIKKDAYEDKGFLKIHDEWKLKREREPRPFSAWNYSGFIDLRWNFFHNDGRLPSSTNNPLEELVIRAEKKWGNKYKAKLSLYQRYQDFDFNKNGRDEAILDLHENYLDIFFNKNDIRIGKQLITWGKTDEINPTDNSNFQDYYHFVIPDRNRRKIPTWAIRNKFYLKNLIFDAVLVPFFEKPRLPNDDSPWLPLQLRAARFVKETPYVPLIEKLPPKSPESVAGGIRLSHRTDTVDYSFSAWSGHSTLPFFKLLPEITTPFGDIPKGAELHYPRISVIGMDISATQGGYGIRGEAGLSLATPYQAKSSTDAEIADTILYKNSFSYVLGADYTYANEAYANLQIGQNIILEDKESIIQDSLESFYTLELRHKIINRWEASFKLTHIFSNGEKWSHYQLKRKLDDGRNFWLAADNFSGDFSKGPIGQFGPNDLYSMRFEQVF